MNAAFRVDASIDIGTGHVMRCLVLADALKIAGFHISFISREHPGHLFGLIRQRGYQLIALPLPSEDYSRSSVFLDTDPTHGEWLGCHWRLDASQTRTALQAMNIDWLVVDHYALDARWERALLGCYQRLFVIDDLADRPHNCDLLLDQTLRRRVEDYAEWVPKQCKLLVGAQYALLRPEFAELRQYSLRRRANPKLERLLISMGGVDKKNVTTMVVSALESCNLLVNVQFTVVMGSQSPWLEQVKAHVAHSHLDIELLVGVSNMAELMSDVDLVIGAAGSTSWERCCLGVPTIMLILAKNQSEVARALMAEKAVYILPDAPAMQDSLINLSYLCFREPWRLAEMSRAAANVTDGAGVQRVLDYL